MDPSLSQNDCPIVGVLAQEIAFKLNEIYPGQYKSYIAASYVKFLEGAGARVLPIWIGREKEYYEDVMTKINGVLFPGGATWFDQSSGFADAGQHIYNFAVHLNETGDHFPLWGTCLGYELMLHLSDNRCEHRIDCNSMSQSLPLDFKPDFRNSRLFGKAPDDVIKILSREAVTTNIHRFCITEEVLLEKNLDKDWKVLSTNEDPEGIKFVSSIESKWYPFYGVQFHPEKNIYEWTSKKICHTKNAVMANRYFADFFVDECRRNQHRFSDQKEEEVSLIYNYQITYTAIKGSHYEQCYLFG